MCYAGQNLFLSLHKKAEHIFYQSEEHKFKLCEKIGMPLLLFVPLSSTTNTVVIFPVGYTMDHMYFSWLDSPVDVDKDNQLPQFTLVDIILYDCSQNYTAG